MAAKCQTIVALQTIDWFTCVILLHGVVHDQYFVESTERINVSSKYNKKFYILSQVIELNLKYLF